MADCVVETRKAKRTKSDDDEPSKQTSKPIASRRNVNIFTAKERTQTGHESFRAVARVKRECERSRVTPRVMRTLMDPGAELNLIRQSLLDVRSRDTKLHVHAREACDITLVNNGKEIGRVTEAVYLSFELDGERFAYREWFHVWDKLDEEMILGSEFCKDNRFTSFHTR